MDKLNYLYLRINLKRADCFCIIVYKRIIEYYLKLSLHREK